MEEQCWNWVERLFKRISMPYPFASVIIAFIFLLIYVIFSLKVSIFRIEDNYVEIAPMCVLIAYQLAGIQYLLNNIRKTLSELKPSESERICIDNPYSRFEQRLTGSYWYYATVVIILVPFILIDIRDFLWGHPLFTEFEPTIWSSALDVYNYMFSYLNNLLFSISLWIIVNIAWMLNELGEGANILLVKMDVLNADKIGGLRRLKDSIIKIIIYYFLSIALMIASYVTPSQFIRSESMVYMLFLLAGILLFFVCFESIRDILSGRISIYMDDINTKYETINKMLLSKISRGNYNDKDKIEFLSTSLEILNHERDRLLQINTGYEFTTLGTFISSLLIPVLTLYEKVSGFIKI